MATAAWLQAVSTVILVIVTGLYVFYTQKMIRSSSKTHLKPLNYGFDGEKRLTISIKNIGNNIALNVKVRTKLKELHKEEQAKREFIGEGSYEILPRQETIYIYEAGLSTDLEDEVIVTWETVTGQKQSSRWIFDERKSLEDCFKRAD